MSAEAQHQRMTEEVVVSSRSRKLKQYHKERRELLEESKKEGASFFGLYSIGLQRGLTETQISRRLIRIKRETANKMRSPDEEILNSANVILSQAMLGLSSETFDSVFVDSDYRRKVNERAALEDLAIRSAECKKAANEVKKKDKKRRESIRRIGIYVFGMMCLGLGVVLGLSGSVRGAEARSTADADTPEPNNGRQGMVLDKPPEFILPTQAVPTEIYAPVPPLAIKIEPKIRPVEMQMADEIPIKAETADTTLGVPLSNGGFLDLTQGLEIVFPSEWKVDPNKKPLYRLKITPDDVRIVDTIEKQASFAQESAQYRELPLLTGIVPVVEQMTVKDEQTGLDEARTIPVPNWALVLMHSGQATQLNNDYFIGQVDSLYGTGSFDPKRPQALPGEIFANLTSKNMGDVILVNGTFFQVTSVSTFLLEAGTSCGSFENGDYKCALGHAGINIENPGFALSTCSGEDHRDRKMLGLTEYVPVQKEVREMTDPGVQEAVRLADTVNMFKFQREHSQMGTYLLKTYPFPDIERVRPVLEGVINPATGFNNGMECQGWVSLRLGNFSPLYTVNDPEASMPEEVKWRVARNVSGAYQDTARRQWVTGEEVVIGQGNVIFEPLGGQPRADGSITGHVAYVEYTGRDEKGTFYVISEANSDGNGMVKIKKVYAWELKDKFPGGIAVLQEVDEKAPLGLGN